MELVSVVGMRVRDSDAGNKGEGVVSSEGDVDKAGGGARWRECCRFPKIFGELLEDLPYYLPFTFNIGNVFL